ncbi:hypothetical protein [Aeribacillus sp. FSL K6-1121]|jgi:putative transposase|uniref:hypothetical protein n=1 Tax=Aeribacillus TaxID=1055323 RepID=UPI0030F5A98B
MKTTGIQSVIRCKKNRYVSSSAVHVAENVLNRKFTASKPNEKWLTDVTEFKIGNGKKAYLSAILDLYSYVLGHSNNHQFVFQTVDHAIARVKSNPALDSWQIKPLLFLHNIQDLIYHKFKRT